MKFLIIALIFAALAWWWFAQRRSAVRDRMRREGRVPRKAKPTELVQCPTCGVYAVRGGHVCELPRG